jgi:hypothetical protein
MEENNIVTTTAETTVEKVYTFRKLCAKDMPLLLRVLKKININKFIDCFQSETVKKVMADNKEDGNLDIITGGAIVLELAQVIISGLSDCTDDLFKLLSETSNLSVKEVENLDFEVITEMIIDFVKKEEFLGFFKAVSKSIQ